MSALYPDLSLTNFPSSLDQFMTFLNIVASDGPLIAQYQAAMEAGNQTQANQILAQMPQAQPLRMTDILEYPGIVKAADVDNDATTAMDAFDGSRSREGEALKKILEANCTKILETVDALAPCIPQIHEQIKAKLTERLEAALSEALSKAGSLT